MKSEKHRYIAGEESHTHVHAYAAAHPGELLVTHHDGALVGSLEKEFPGTADSWKPAVTDAICKIKDYVTNHGGIIGHIKAYTETIHGGFSFSTTGNDLTVRELEDTRVKLHLAVIVFFTDEEDLKQKTAEIISSISI